jgi:hypothetical protein
MNHPNLRPQALVLFAIAGFAMAACGSPSGSSAGVDNGSPAPGGEVTIGESVPVPYTDSRFHYRIDAPGHMTANADGTAAYIGPSERMEISVLTGSGSLDAVKLANQDLQSLAKSATAFHQLSNPESLSLSGHHVTRFAYTWNAGTSAVTGKAIELTSVRYYVTKDATTMAVITYGIVSNQFDPQGADDIVSTFQWQ